MLTRYRARKAGKERAQPLPGRARAYIGAVAAAAVGLAVYVATSTHPMRVPGSVPWPLVAIALAGLAALPVRFHMIHKEDHTLSINLVGLPLMIGAIFTSPAGFMVAVTLAQVATVIRRRDPLARAVFNMGNQLLSTALARLVLVAALAGADPVSPRGWVAVILAIITIEVPTVILVVGVVTLTAGPPGKQYLKSVLLHLTLLVPVNAALSIVAVTVAWTQPWALLLLGGAGLLLALWYRASNTVRSRYANLQQLYDFTVALSGLSESDQVLQVALTESCRTLRSHHAELCVSMGDQAMRYSVDDEGDLLKETVELSDAQRQVLRTREPMLVIRDRKDKAASARPFSDLMAVPLKLGDDEVGVLLVADRQGEKATFDSEDLRLFEALAANLSTALTSSGRLDQLRSEVAAREHQALHDGLTGLANRTLFKHWVSTALARRKSAHLVAVMLMDLDGFKEINDTLGHHTGDALLQETAARLLAAVGPEQLAARLGGDEFAFVVPAAKSPEEVLEYAHHILDAVSQPIAVDGLMLSLRASIGVSMAPQHGADPSSLLKRADVAMYVAKNNHRGVMAYDPEIDHNTTRKLILGSELSQAIEVGDLEVWYMPVAHLRNGQISGFEALLRWRHDHYGPVSPNEFIPVAEQTGLIGPITWWVLRESLGEVKRWREEGYELTVSVNVSARSLLDTEIVERMSDLIDEVGVSPSSLVVEITESSMMVEPDRSEAILRRISDLGIKIAIDDFGTGYSSLSRLKRMPVHMVKIDRSFVMHMCADDGDDAIVRATIELARNMGHTVIAEGVEDRNIWDRLLELGCHQAQGYYLSRAMPASECIGWLDERQPNHLAPIRVLRGLAHGA